MRALMRRLIKDESGATAIEYALIAVMIALVIITSVTNVGDALIPIFDAVVAGFASE